MYSFPVVRVRATDFRNIQNERFNYEFSLYKTAADFKIPKTTCGNCGRPTRCKNTKTKGQKTIQECRRATGFTDQIDHQKLHVCRLDNPIMSSVPMKATKKCAVALGPHLDQDRRHLHSIMSLGFASARSASFSTVSKPNFASKYSFESSRRDLHNTLLCTATRS